MTPDGIRRVVPVPNVTVEVADVDACTRPPSPPGETVAHPLTDEPWGVRRSFVEDPNGVVVNVMQHLAPAAAEA